MSRVYPPRFAEYCKSTSLRGAFVSIIEPLSKHDCPNCGGIGTLVIFLATEGPFDFVPYGKGIIAKSVKIHDVDKWFGGKHVEEMCPVCRGTGRDPNYVEQPVVKRDCRVAEVVKAVER